MYVTLHYQGDLLFRRDSNHMTCPSAAAQKRNCPANEADWAKYKPDAGAQPKSLKLKVKPHAFQEL